MMILYSEKGCNLEGSIIEGCINIYSRIDIDDFKSEIGYLIDNDNTKKLLRIISLEEFWKLCNKGTYNILEYLDLNDIKYSIHQYY